MPFDLTSLLELPIVQAVLRIGLILVLAYIVALSLGAQTLIRDFIGAICNPADVPHL